MSDENTFTCVVCRETFDFAWSDEEAMAEYRRDYPALAAADVPTDVVCDDCYQRFNAWKSELPSEEIARMDAGALDSATSPQSALPNP